MMICLPAGRLTTAARLQKVPAERSVLNWHRCTGRQIALSLLQSPRPFLAPLQRLFAGCHAAPCPPFASARDVQNLNLVWNFFSASSSFVKGNRFSLP
jgi:hypothetical protein